MKILVLGATSAITQACLKRWADQGFELYLVARDPHKLKEIHGELSRTHPAGSFCSEILDLNDTAAHAALFERANQELEGIDCVFICYGAYGDEAQNQTDLAAARSVYEANLISPVSLLIECTRWIGKLGLKQVAVVTSVAGDRGRYSNYVYGSSKAGLSTFLSGYRTRMEAQGVRVLDIKPGLIRTPMTAYRVAPHWIWANILTVARDIDRAIRRKRDVLYTPGIWRWIMFCVCALPEWIYKRIRW